MTSNTVTFTATPREIAAALQHTAHEDPQLYSSIRRSIPREYLRLVAAMAGGLRDLDRAAGYTNA